MTRGSGQPEAPGADEASGQDDDLSAAPARTGHSANAGRALAWSLTNTMVGRFGTLAIGIVLARVLGPQEFGTYAIAFVALMAILSFNELGVSLAIVRWKDDPARIAPTVTTISLGMSAVLTLVAVLAAPAFTSAMGDPQATSLVRLLSLAVLINGAVATPAALMERMFRQDQRLVADQVNVWVGAIVSVLLALTGLGAMSLVVGRLAGAGLSALLFLRYSPLPYRLGWDRQYVRPLLLFGLPLAGSSVIVFVVGFADQLIVGHQLGSVELGFYVLAANLSSWPVTLFSQPLRNVAPALFSRLQHDPTEMRAGFFQVLRPLSAVALPICVVISVAAPEIVQFVYGDAWAPAGIVLRWLAVLAALRIFFEFAYDFLVVLNRSTAILVIQLVWIVALVPALIYGVHQRGIVGAAIAMVVVSAVLSVPMYLVEFHRASIELRRVLSATAVPLITAALVGLVSLGVTRFVDAAFPALAVVGLLSAAASAGLLWLYRADLRVFRVRSVE